MVEYRGHKITSQETPFGFQLSSDHYDAWTEDGAWTCNGLAAHGATEAEALDELKDWIDDYED